MFLFRDDFVVRWIMYETNANAADCQSVADENRQCSEVASVTVKFVVCRVHRSMQGFWDTLQDRLVFFA